MFLTTDEPLLSPVSFASAEVAKLDQVRSAGFEYRDRGWQPRSQLTDRVFMSEPDSVPDLAVVRPPARPSAAARRYELITRVRRGGLVFFVNGIPADFPGGCDLHRVGADPRLFEKMSAAAPPTEAGAPSESLTSWTRHQELVRSHLPLAKSLARRYAHRGEPLDDLVQVAELALIRAAGRYRDDRGTSFSTFATASVLGELKRHFRDKTWTIRVPRRLQEQYLEVKKARDELGHQLGRSPTVDQIAVHLGTTPEMVLEAMEASYSYTPASLDAPRREDDEVYELPSTESGYEAALNRAWLQVVLPALDDDEQLVIRRLYFDGQTQRSVGLEMHVSQMQISRIHARALERLREAAGALAPSTAQ